MDEQNSQSKEHARDDSHLSGLVAETRAWMTEQGMEERPLDWEAIARQEDALWWQRRVAESLKQLAAGAQGFPTQIATYLQQLSATAGGHAEAALGVTLEGIGQVGRVVSEVATEAFLRPGVALEFQYASPAQRNVVRGRKRKGKSERASKGQESTGIFVSATIPHGEIAVEEQRVTIELPSSRSLPLVVLVPEDTETDPRIAQGTRLENGTRFQFDELPSGHYVITIYYPEEPGR